MQDVKNTRKKATKCKIAFLQANLFMIKMNSIKNLKVVLIGMLLTKIKKNTPRGQKQSHKINLNNIPQGRIPIALMP